MKKFWLLAAILILIVSMVQCNDLEQDSSEGSSLPEPIPEEEMIELPDDQEKIKQLLDGLMESPVGQMEIKKLFDSLMKVGVKQEFTPEQPIKFSHKIHAVDLKIECNYCHQTQKGQTASIPSVSTCLNCHKVPNKEPALDSTLNENYRKLMDEMRPSKE